MMEKHQSIKNLYALAEQRFIPLNMLLELTYRCNEHCLHCYLPETQGVRDPREKDELSAEAWGGVLEQLAEAGTMYLILSGGEVLLRKDFHDILRRARELYFSVEIFTNATLLTADIADMWADQNVDRVGISVYSPNAVWHDRVTKLKGSFEKTMNGVRLLKDRGITVTLKCPMMKLNFGNYSSLISLAEEMGVRYKFDPMLVPRNDGSDIPLRLEMKDGQLKAAYQDERLIPSEDVSGSASLDPHTATCSAGRTSGAIGPYGDVFPCIQWMIPAGNVKEKPFEDIWWGADILSRARRYTGQDVKPCPKCGGPHVIHCLGLSEMEHHDPLIPSTDSCRLTQTIRQIQEERRHG